MRSARKSLFSAATLSLALFPSVSAHAADIVSFSDAPIELTAQKNYVENGVTVTSIDGNFWAWPTPGQLHLDLTDFGNSAYDFTYSGGSFDLVSFDLSTGGLDAVGRLASYDSFGGLLNSVYFNGSVEETLSYPGFANGLRIRISAVEDHFSIDNFAIFSPAVPEPSTWAMMLFGFFAVGGATRFTKRRQKELSVAISSVGHQRQR